MSEKKKYKGFAVAAGTLQVCDYENVREHLMTVNQWKSSQNYGQKESGKRCSLEINCNGINEVANIEAAFANFGIDAWTGDPIPINHATQ